MKTSIFANAFAITQTSVDAGSNIDILFNWENLGTDTLEDIEIDFYLSDNYWISTTDYQLGSYKIESIAGKQETGTQNITLQLPEEEAEFWGVTKNGAYYVGMLINGETEVYPYQLHVNQDFLKVNINSLIDLTGKSFTITNLDTDTVEVDFEIANLAAGDVEPFTVDFYLSGDEAIASDDYYLGSYEVSDLVGNSQTDLLNTSLTLPEANNPFWLSEEAGVYHVGMIINQDGAVNEYGNLENNSNQGELIDYQGFIKEEPFLADLRGVSFDIVGEESLIPNQEITVDFAIANTSLKAVTGDFNVSFYLSADSSIVPTDTFLSSYRVTDGSLTARDLLEQTVSLTLPEPSDPVWAKVTDRYYVGMIVDSDDEISEINESDNSNLEQLVDYDGAGGFLDEFRANIPDLTMSYLKVANHVATANDTIELEFTVSNISQSSAEPFSVSFYLSDNKYISPDDVKLGSSEISEGLAAGISTTDIISQSFSLPDLDEELWRYQGNGTYYVGAIVDQENQITEYYEANNSNSGYQIDYDPILVKDIALADLVATEFQIDQEWVAQPEAEVNLKFQILNQAIGDAGNFDVKFYLSNNEYISTDDVLVGSYSLESLAGNTSTGELNTTISLPDADNYLWDTHLFGTYYLGMLIDPSNEVAEFTQLNNNNQGQYLDSDAIDILGINADSDLVGVNFNVIPEASIENPLIVGDDFDLNYEIANKGEDAVEFSATNFFLFTEDYLNNHNKIEFEDVNNADSGLYFLFGDQDSNLIQLEPNTTTGELTTNLSLPEDLTPGYYYVGMLNDQYREVNESNELNNSLNAEFVNYEQVYIDII